MSDEIRELEALATTARLHAHAPYSGFRVGAALLDDRGNVHVGCNVENAAYPEGNCAETSAIAAMVVSGGRIIRNIVIVGGGDSLVPCTPCGGCRQRIAEFSDAGTRVWLVDDDGGLQSRSVEDLLPGGFRLGGESERD